MHIALVKNVFRINSIIFDFLILFLMFCNNIETDKAALKIVIFL